MNGMFCKDVPPARGKDEPPAARDSQVHCLICPVWTHLREDLDLTDIRCIDDMVTYFQREKKRRKREREEEEKLRQEGERQKRKRGR